jgi:hypothetical protein
MKRGHAATIVAEVQRRVANWRQFAEEAGVAAVNAEHIQQSLNLSPYS